MLYHSALFFLLFIMQTCAGSVAIKDKAVLVDSKEMLRIPPATEKELFKILKVLKKHMSMAKFLGKNKFLTPKEKNEILTHKNNDQEIYDIIWHYHGYLTYAILDFFCNKQGIKDPDTELSWPPVVRLSFNDDASQLKATLGDSTEIVWEVFSGNCIASQVYKTFLEGWDYPIRTKPIIEKRGSLFAYHSRVLNDEITIPIVCVAPVLMRTALLAYNERKKVKSINSCRIL